MIIRRDVWFSDNDEFDSVGLGAAGLGAAGLGVGSYLGGKKVLSGLIDTKEIKEISKANKNLKSLNTALSKVKAAEKLTKRAEALDSVGHHLDVKDYLKSLGLDGKGKNKPDAGKVKEARAFYNNAMKIVKENGGGGLSAADKLILDQIRSGKHLSAADLKAIKDFGGQQAMLENMTKSKGIQRRLYDFATKNKNLAKGLGIAGAAGLGIGAAGLGYSKLRERD